MIITLEDWKKYCIKKHDIDANQKYSGLPYSFHLKMVENQYEKFKHLLDDTPEPECLFPSQRNQAYTGCWGHDLIEDARVTYNDIVNEIGVKAAEVIFLCTEMRGRNRAERKNDEFYNTLKTNNVAVFVKLCDIIANMMYGALEGSSMFEKSKKEWPKIKEHLYREEFKPMFDYIDKICEL